MKSIWKKIVRVVWMLPNTNLQTITFTIDNLHYRHRDKPNHSLMGPAPCYSKLCQLSAFDDWGILAAGGSLESLLTKRLKWATLRAPLLTLIFFELYKTRWRMTQNYCSYLLKSSRASVSNFLNTVHIYFPGGIIRIANIFCRWRLPLVRTSWFLQSDGSF